VSSVADHLNLDQGLVECAVYSPEIYREELPAVFGRSWLFVGHVQQLPRPGDYLTTWMGETPVVVLRGRDGVVRVFVNACRTTDQRFFHYDVGRADSIECRIHRRGYDDTGAPLGAQDAVGDAAPGCLVAATSVEEYGGLLFAVMGTPLSTLREWLGDAAWYLDNYLLREDIGGLKLISGMQRYNMPGNWKLLAENFAGDDYHVAVTHASVLGLRAQKVEPRLINSPGKGEGGIHYSIATGYGQGVPHGLLEVRVGDQFYEHDLMRARTLSDAAVDWVRLRRDTIDRRLPDLPAKPYSFHVGNLFPTLSIIGNGTAMEAVGLLVWHPRGPYETSVTEIGFVDAGAPADLQEQMAFSLVHQQAAAGIFAPDDHENFERLSENTRTFQARKVPFNYEMGLAGSGGDVRPPEWQDPRWPGLVLPRFTEQIQRDFYRYWRELMDDDGAAA
jgi:phenylpropionate dioxygenase-like ring-hydroxylating dioxygenase large terminal subunit